MVDLIKYPIWTDKSFNLTKQNQYTFAVDSTLSKPQIKRLIEDLYKITVISVNTHRPPRKKKRLGLSQGFKGSYKKAIITTKKGDLIEFFLDV